MVAPWHVAKLWLLTADGGGSKFALVTDSLPGLSQQRPDFNLEAIGSAHPRGAARHPGSRHRPGPQPDPVRPMDRNAHQ